MKTKIFGVLASGFVAANSLEATLYGNGGQKFIMEFDEDLKDGKFWCPGSSSGTCGNAYEMCRQHDSLCGFDSSPYNMIQMSGMNGHIKSFDVPDGYEIVVIGRSPSGEHIKSCTTNADCAGNPLSKICASWGSCFEDCSVGTMARTLNTDTAKYGPGKYQVEDWIRINYVNEISRLKIRKTSESPTSCPVKAATVFKADGTAFNIPFDTEFTTPTKFYAPTNTAGEVKTTFNNCENDDGMCGATLTDGLPMPGFDSKIASFNVPTGYRLVAIGRSPGGDAITSCQTDADCAHHRTSKVCASFGQCFEPCTNIKVGLNVNTDTKTYGPGKYSIDSWTSVFFFNDRSRFRVIPQEDSVDTCRQSVNTPPPVPSPTSPPTFGAGDIKTLIGDITPCIVKHGWLSAAQLKTGFVMNETGALVETLEEEYSVEGAARVLLWRLNLLATKMEEFYNLDGSDMTHLQLAKSLVETGYSDELFGSFKTVTSFLKKACPLPPLMTWQSVASCSQQCETTLTRGLSNSISNMNYVDFYKSYADSRGEEHGTEVVTTESRTDTTGGTDTRSRTVTDEFSVTAGAEVGFFGFGSASIETSYHHSDSRTHEYSRNYETSRTSENSRSASFGVSRDFTEEVAQTQAREFSREVSRSEEESCAASCEIEGKVVYVFQWVQIQQDARSKKDAVTKTCHYICSSDVQGPVCPYGRCANEECSECLANTFADPALDQVYSNSLPGPGDNEGISTGLIAGISVGAAALAAIVVAGVIMHKKRQSTNLDNQNIVSAKAIPEI